MLGLCGKKVTKEVPQLVGYRIKGRDCPKGVREVKVRELIERLEKVENKEAIVVFEDDDCIVDIAETYDNGFEIILGGKAT